MGMNEDDEEDDEESPKSRTGRFSIQHRGGTRVEVSEPIHIGGETPWMCAVKLVGHKGPELDSDQTQTLLVRTGRGATPEEAQRNAMGQLTLVYGSPVDPPPSPMISQKISEPPPPPDPEPDAEEEEEPKRPSLLQRIFGRKK